MIRIAHRGASGYEFENSMSAFKKAIELGIKYIELDVRLTSDNQLVVFHDERLDRCTNSVGNIRDLAYEELHSNTLLSNGEKIPSLEDVCHLFKSHGVNVLIELKEDNIAFEVYEVVTGLLKSNTFIIGSFFHKQIFEIKNKHPALQTCIMFECYPINLTNYVNELKANFVAFGFETSSSLLVEEIKRANAKALVWTVNDLVDLEKAKKFNVDGIISNFPDRI